MPIEEQAEAAFRDLMLSKYGIAEPMAPEEDDEN